MKRILLSLLVILGAGAAIAVGGTGAFFSDTESSTGNTFTAGAIDLKVDNESYYDGNVCAENPSAGIGEPDQPYFIWQGNQPYPVPGTPCSTSWELSDLDHGLLFFNFNDIKPDDEGEDTISLHVNNNDAYACMDLTLTSNDDKSSTEPELGTPDAQEDINNTWDGELAQNIQMFWWADDGDNVYETGENTISGGVKTLMSLATTSPFSVALADSVNNVWTPNTPGPISGDQTKYIAKTWCFGTLTTPSVSQDNLGKVGTPQNPTNIPNGPMVRPSAIACDGTALNNLTQTDGVTLDVAFRAVQARHNQTFTCGNTLPRTAKIAVIKIVHNNHGGNNTIPDFQLSVDNGIVTTNVTSGATTTVAAGNYTVAETGVSGYIATFSGACAANGSITLAPGEEKTCFITNTDQEAHITLIKNVINNNGGTAQPTGFGLMIDGNPVSHNSSVTVNSNTPHLINENGRVGYHFVSISGVGCPAGTSTPIILNEGESITCTITNDDN